MMRPRFDTIWKYIHFSDQPDVRSDNMSSEHHRWRLVDDFVKNFNDHWAEMFIPSDKICVDESISCWYGLGGYWINLGFAHIRNGTIPELQIFDSELFLFL
jgi:hypothetical protein